MTIANEELLRKATFTTDALVAQGTSLSIEQVTTFLRLAITPQVMLPDVRTVTSAAARWQEAHVDFSNRILRPGVQGTRLADTDRSQPETEMIEIDTVLVRGEIPIADEVMEDNFEREGFGNTVMAMVAEASGRDIEDLMINGDTTSSDPYYALTDGWIKRTNAAAGGNVLDGSTFGDDYQALFLSMLQSLPAKYKRDKPNMRFYVPLSLEENYRASLASRGTPLGDALLSGSQPLLFQDVAIVPVPLINVTSNTATVVLAHRLNLYAGFHRQIRMETWRDPREGATSWVVTARVAPAVGHPPATVQATSVQVAG